MARDGREPRVRDLALAKTLGFDRPANIRNVIRRHKDELASYGQIVTIEDGVCFNLKQNTQPRGKGRPGVEYWLNEEQALLVCMFARTANAAAARKVIIDVFMAWRRNASVRPQLPAPNSANAGRIRAAKLRLAEAIATLDSYGVDVMAIDVGVVRDFGRAFLAVRSA
jgi:hypothetical protein